MKIKTDDGEELTLEFADTFFETFPGTPEELEELMSTLVEKIKDGSFFDEIEPAEEYGLDDDDDIEELIYSLEQQKKRTIQ